MIAWTRCSGSVWVISRRSFHSSSVFSCTTTTTATTQPPPQVPFVRSATVSVEGTPVVTIPVIPTTTPLPCEPLNIPVNLDPLPNVERTHPDDGWFKARLRKYLKGNMLHTGETLAKATFKHCENEAFRAQLGLPGDDFSILSLKALHMWILQQRITEDVAAGSDVLIHRLYDVLWDDLDNGMNKKGFVFLSKHKQHAQSAIYGGLVTYDRTLQIGAAESDYSLYLGTLWRHLYASNRTLDKNRLVQMRDYIVEQRMRIRGVSNSDFYDGLIEWGQPPPLTQSAEAERLDPEVVLKVLYPAGSEEMRYGYSRTPLRKILFEKDMIKGG